VKRAIIRCAIAEKGHTDILAAQQFKAIASASSLQDARADDSAGAHHAHLRREQMHTATAPLRAAGHAPKQLGHHGCRRHAFRQRVAVAAVRAEHRVLMAQMRAYARRNCLLANVGVTCTMDQPGLISLRQLLLGAANHKHLAIQP
jgi:hypothetical protein